jgi:hypothetical protein
MSKMRTTFVALVIAGGLVGLAVDRPARAGAAERPLATVETLLGAWNGYWLTDGRVAFPLVGDGQIVLEAVDGVRPGTAARLHGTWTDARGALPAPQGMIELDRAN